MTRLLVAALAVVCALPCAPGPAAAQSADIWPVRPVRVVVPFAPGGALDTGARAVSRVASIPGVVRVDPSASHRSLKDRVDASTPLEYAADLRRGIDRWTPVVKAAGVKPGN